MFANFFQPCIKAAIFLFEGADAEGFKVPTVFTIVLRGEFGPEGGDLFGIIHVERKSAFAADLRSGIIHEFLNNRKRVLVLNPRVTQSKVSNIWIFVFDSLIEI